MNIGTLPDGSKGFDANQRVTPEQARDAVAKGYTFAARYVRRSAANNHDLIAGEMATLLTAGLGLAVVQHVALEGWIPAASLGASYGSIAANEATHAGVPRGVTVFCDLEGVRSGTPATDVIRFCNTWHEKVTEAGYHAGLYVGDSCGLSGVQLYRDLKFDCYWKAYNGNRDQTPIVRGYSMYQHAATLADLIVGLTNQTMDVNIVQADKLGGSPIFLRP
jgi:hypothetical protein